MILSNKWLTKALISLCRCAGWSAPLLFANPRSPVFLSRGLDDIIMFPELFCRRQSTTLFCRRNKVSVCRYKSVPKSSQMVTRSVEQKPGQAEFGKLVQEELSQKGAVSTIQLYIGLDLRCLQQSVTQTSLLSYRG